ncbi:hypothetical protein L0F63_000193 [Massospora cicadina]|nr:hypothetical protein L0F63_000193 [Massospora cicadina]
MGGGALPSGIFQLLLKRAQAGSASPPNATGCQVSPQDLAHHLTSSQAVVQSLWCSHGAICILASGSNM